VSKTESKIKKSCWEKREVKIVYFFGVEEKKKENSK